MGKHTCRRASVALVVLALSAQLWAQEAKVQHTTYRLFEVGTFGGPNSLYQGATPIATEAGVMVGAANTSDPDPDAPNCFNDSCFVQHALKWDRGRLIDLGVLSGGHSSYTNAINARGQIVGQSQDGTFDPVTGLPAFLATVWDRGEIRNLGTLGGAFSIAISNTNQSFVMGAAENGVEDTSGFVGFNLVSEIRGFGWDGKRIFDLGTLGGTGTFPNAMNDSEEIVGISTTSSVPGPFGAPAADPFLWRRGRMHDLGTLGGSFGTANAINRRGQVAGVSSIASEPYACLAYFSPGCHAFLWEDGRLKDLGTLGGSYAAGEEINNAGQISGASGIAGDKFFHAFFWKQSIMNDLGTIGNDNYSRAFGMNDKGQVVGQSWLYDGMNTTTSHAFVWNGAGPMIDVNTVISNPTDLYLTEANFITDRGWIVANGVLPNGDLRAAVLVPEAQAWELGVPRAQDSVPSAERSSPAKPGAEALRRMQSQWTPLDRYTRLRTLRKESLIRR